MATKLAQASHDFINATDRLDDESYLVAVQALLLDRANKVKSRGDFELGLFMDRVFEATEGVRAVLLKPGD
jgi:hypothetical protein